MENIETTLGSGKGPRVVDENRLDSDLNYRFWYVAEFIDFSEDDANTINRIGPAILPRIPEMVDTVFEKLFSYDATIRHVLPWQSFDSKGDGEEFRDVRVDREVVDYQKNQLAEYLETLVTSDCDEEMVVFLDNIGRYYTPKLQNSKINVPHVQMNVLLGLIADIVKSAVYELMLDRETEIRTIRAFSKLLWIQSDLVSRHYRY